MTLDPTYNKPLFTYAASVPIRRVHRYSSYYNQYGNDQYGDYKALLLFEDKLPFPKWELIVNDPLPAKILKYPYVLYQGQPNNYIIATANLERVFTENFENEDVPPLLIAHNAEKTEVYNGKQMYLQCAHPHKHIISCRECIEKIPLKDAQCMAKTLIQQHDQSSDETMDMESVRDILVNKKTEIGPFTMVSPVLTADNAISSSYRPFEAHDFDMIESQVQSRQLAQTERKRFSLFQQETCSQCMVQKECSYLDHGTKDWGRRYCRGCYAGTEQQNARIVLRQQKIPYTGEQLMILLRNSGELDRRYDRRKYYLTFKITHNPVAQEFVFGLNRFTNPGEFIPIRSFKNAMEIIKEYKDNYITSTTERLTAIQKAALVELVNQDYSPRQQAGWHQTEYAALGVTYRPGGDLIQSYTWNSGGELPWSVRIKTLKEFYAHYGRFAFLSKTHSSLSRGGLY